MIEIYLDMSGERIELILGMYILLFLYHISFEHVLAMDIHGLMLELIVHQRQDRLKDRHLEKKMIIREKMR